MGLGLVAGLGGALEGLVFLHHLFHLGLDGLEVLRRKAVLEVEVVVKAVSRRRADVELGLRPEAKHGGREYVGARMPQALEIAHLVALLDGLAFHVVFGCFHGSGCRDWPSAWLPRRVGGG